MDNATEEKISVIIHSLIAVVVGFASIKFELWLSFIIGIVVLFLLGYIGDFAFGKKGFKWWVSNGMLIYLLIWIVSWIYFFNVLV